VYSNSREEKFGFFSYVSNIERKPSIDTIVAVLNIVHTKVLEDYQNSVYQPIPIERAKKKRVGLGKPQNLMK
jgi:hypothetical protein